MKFTQLTLTSDPPFNPFGPYPLPLAPCPLPLPLPLPLFSPFFLFLHGLTWDDAPRPVRDDIPSPDMD